MLENRVQYVGKALALARSDDHKLYAFDAECRNACLPLWSFTTAGPIHSSPAVTNGVIYIGSDDGKLYALGLS
jgi:outer membrane protein assembly factor BamB